MSHNYTSPMDTTRLLRNLIRVFGRVRITHLLQELSHRTADQDICLDYNITPAQLQLLRLSHQQQKQQKAQ